MFLLEHPEAQALLGDATVSADTVRGCTDRLTGLLRRCLPKLYRTEQRQNATTVIRGLLSGGTHDLRADRHRSRPGSQADPVLRRGRQVGR